jgi:hypothetical protein
LSAISILIFVNDCGSLKEETRNPPSQETLAKQLNIP